MPRQRHEGKIKINLDRTNDSLAAVELLKFIYDKSTDASTQKYKADILNVYEECLKAVRK